MQLLELIQMLHLIEDIYNNVDSVLHLFYFQIAIHFHQFYYKIRTQHDIFQQYFQVH